MAELRDYQDTAIFKLRQSLGAGKKRPVVQMPTGAGKTVVAAEIINMALAKGKKIMFCVSSLSLIDQTVERFRENGIYDVGVIQAMHELTNFYADVQVASVQTLMRRKIIQKVDLVIIDECHVQFKFYAKWMQMDYWKDIPFIGLTATPWAKSMGKLWDDLIVGTTMTDLIEQGHLSKFKVFAPSHPDLTGVKTVAGDYDIGQLGDAMDKKPLVADIVSTWIEKGENRPTICFAVNRTHAKNIQEQFEAAGIRTGYVDAFSDIPERNQIAKDFHNGDIKVVCNVGVLTTGVDWDVRCIILARPTRSEILYVQMIGRGLRTAKGKEDCIILDHSDTTLSLGFVTDIHHNKLDMGHEKKKPAKAEPKEKLPKECHACSYLKPPSAFVCPNCGAKPNPRADVDHIGGELHELDGNKNKKPTQYTSAEKELFYRELLGYTEIKNYSKGWAAHKYKAKFGSWPFNGISKQPKTPSPAVMSWITHLNIAQAKSKKKSFDRKFSGERKTFNAAINRLKDDWDEAAFREAHKNDAN